MTDRELIENLYDRIQRLRRRRGISTAAFAEKVGTSGQALYRMQSHSPTVQLLSRFAEALDCTLVIQFKEKPKHAQRSRATSDRVRQSTNVAAATGSRAGNGTAGISKTKASGKKRKAH